VVVIRTRGFDMGIGDPKTGFKAALSQQDFWGGLTSERVFALGNPFL